MDNAIFRQQFILDIIDQLIQPACFSSAAEFDRIQKEFATIKKLVFSRAIDEKALIKIYQQVYSDPDIQTKMEVAQQAVQQKTDLLRDQYETVRQSYNFLGRILFDHEAMLSQDASYMQWLLDQKRQNIHFNFIAALTQWQTTLRAELDYYYRAKLATFGSQLDAVTAAQKTAIEALHSRQLALLDNHFQSRLIFFKRYQALESQQDNRQEHWRSAILGEDFYTTRPVEASQAAVELLSPFVLKGGSNFPQMLTAKSKNTFPSNKEEVKKILREFLRQAPHYPSMGIDISHFPESLREYAYFKAAKIGIDPDWVHTSFLTKSDVAKAKKLYLHAIKQQDKTVIGEEIPLEIKLAKKPIDIRYLQENTFLALPLADKKKIFSEYLTVLQRAKMLANSALSLAEKRVFLSTLNPEQFALILNSYRFGTGLGGAAGNLLSPMTVRQLFFLYPYYKKPVFEKLHPHLQRILAVSAPAKSRKLLMAKASQIRDGEDLNLLSRLVRDYVKNKRKDDAFFEKLPEKIRDNKKLRHMIQRFNYKIFGYRTRTLQLLFDSLPSDNQTASLIAAGLLFTLNEKPKLIVNILRKLTILPDPAVQSAQRYQAILPALGEEVVLAIFKLQDKHLTAKEKEHMFSHLSLQQQGAVLAQAVRLKRSDSLKGKIDQYTVDELAVLLNNPPCSHAFFPVLMRDADENKWAAVLDNKNLNFDARVEIMNAMLRNTDAALQNKIKKIIADYVQTQDESSLAHWVNQVPLEFLPIKSQINNAYPFNFLTQAQREEVMKYISDPELVQKLRAIYPVIPTEEDLSDTASVLSAGSFADDEITAYESDVDDVLSLDDVDFSVQPDDAPQPSDDELSASSDSLRLPGVPGQPVSPPLSARSRASTISVSSVEPIIPAAQPPEEDVPEQPAPSPLSARSRASTISVSSVEPIIPAQPLIPAQPPEGDDVSAHAASQPKATAVIEAQPAVQPPVARPAVTADVRPPIVTKPPVVTAPVVTVTMPASAATEVSDPVENFFLQVTRLHENLAKLGAADNYLKQIIEFLNVLQQHRTLFQDVELAPALQDVCHAIEDFSKKEIIANEAEPDQLMKGAKNNLAFEMLNLSSLLLLKPGQQEKPHVLLLTKVLNQMSDLAETYLQLGARREEIEKMKRNMQSELEDYNGAIRRLAAAKRSLKDLVANTWRDEKELSRLATSIAEKEKRDADPRIKELRGRLGVFSTLAGSQLTKIKQEISRLKEKYVTLEAANKPLQKWIGVSSLPPKIKDDPDSIPRADGLVKTYYEIVGQYRNKDTAGLPQK